MQVRNAWRLLSKQTALNLQATEVRADQGVFDKNLH